MPSVSLIDQLIQDYPQFNFQNASAYRWSPQSRTIYYCDDQSQIGQLTLLHELGHAIAGHADYHKDIELIACEREAWLYASQLAGRYKIKLSDEIIQSHLDSYREWLHARSRCPTCLSAGIQHRDLTYHCVLCLTSWTANDARQCSLRRYAKK